MSADPSSSSQRSLPPGQARSRGPARRKISARQTKGWQRDRRRAAFLAIGVTLLFCGLLGGYGLHTQMSRSAAQARDIETARATADQLSAGAVLFVPRQGSVCRRRWLDNATWTLRDGGAVDCDDAAAWHSALPSRESNVERRLEAISNVFQPRAGKVE